MLDCMLTKEDVQHIATLARIRLSDAEIEIFQKDLGTILDFVGKLNELDTKDMEATSQVTGLANVYRNDEAAREESLCEPEALLFQAPGREGNYVKVKAVFE